MSGHEIPFDFGVAASAIESIPVAIRTRRERLGLSLRQVADAAGLSFMTVSRVEAGKGFDARTAVRLMRWLDGPPMPQQCDKPPAGWWCSRAAGHSGPCAARESE